MRIRQPRTYAHRGQLICAGELDGKLRRAQIDDRGLEIVIGSQRPLDKPVQFWIAERVPPRVDIRITARIRFRVYRRRPGRVRSAALVVRRPDRDGRVCLPTPGNRDLGPRPRRARQRPACGNAQRHDQQGDRAENSAISQNQPNAKRVGLVDAIQRFPFRRKLSRGRQCCNLNPLQALQPAETSER